ncbi:hypothetical protein FISHEDRAFT_70664 [Fistulina hepatica ATCC 64428]|uniref:Uncharacterized protein n=1 Tax=Fistulina hepatica ATCC 64428 TaxID=1128425 RepID=A0A0D7AIN7_9AGAR|nr:hypothetical protein FISHEDRAFT_70664 [Fistulina hepatica ATCC 64428]
MAYGIKNSRCRRHYLEWDALAKDRRRIARTSASMKVLFDLLTKSQDRLLRCFIYGLQFCECTTKGAQLLDGTLHSYTAVERGTAVLDQRHAVWCMSTRKLSQKNPTDEVKVTQRVVRHMLAPPERYAVNARGSAKNNGVGDMEEMGVGKSQVCTAAPRREHETPVEQWQ